MSTGSSDEQCFLENVLLPLLLLMLYPLSRIASASLTKSGWTGINDCEYRSS